MTTLLLVCLGIAAGIAVAVDRALRRTIVIHAPSLGLLNLAGESGELLLAEDLKHVGPLFAAIRRSDGGPPACDILLLYCDIEASGKVTGSRRTLRELIRDSGASIVVVAKSHPVEAYIAATPKLGFGKANLVMTLDRNGAALPTFLARLFGKMSRGMSMPVAWNDLAPQIPGMAHPDAPTTIFSCERGQIAFGPAQPGVAADGASSRS